MLKPTLYIIYKTKLNLMPFKQATTKQHISQNKTLNKQIESLRVNMDQIIEKLKLLTNPTALKRLEQELNQIQTNIDEF